MAYFKIVVFGLLLVFGAWAMDWVADGWAAILAGGNFIAPLLFIGVLSIRRRAAQSKGNAEMDPPVKIAILQRVGDHEPLGWSDSAQLFRRPKQ